MNERSRRAATPLWCPLLVRFLARATRQISSPKRRATTGRLSGGISCGNGA